MSRFRNSTIHFMNFDAWRYYLRGRFFQQLGRTERALDEYRLAMRQDAAHARAAHALAYLLAGKQRWTEACEAMEGVVALNPRNPNAWFNLGYLREQLGNHTAAIDAFRNAVSRNPKHDRAWYGLGLALVALGETPAAIEPFEKAATLEPMNGHVWYQLGLCHHRLDDTEKVRHVVRHLDRFDRQMAKKLIEDTGRADLAHVVADLQSIR